jgi:hypothetical protein
MTTITDSMRRKGRRQFIESYQFPQALRRNLIAELGDTRKADIALDGLRGWYLACLYADGALIGMPSQAVDEAWHEMILMTREYTWFCEQAFGHYLHHSPDSTLTTPMDTILAETLAIVDTHELPMTLFTADEDAGLESGYAWKPTDLHRMRDANTTRARRRRKRRSAWDGGYYAGGSTGGCGSGSDGGGWSFFGFGGGDGGGGSDGGGGGGGGGGGCGGGGCGGGGG